MGGSALAWVFGSGMLTQDRGTLIPLDKTELAASAFISLEKSTSTLESVEEFKEPEVRVVEKIVEVPVIKKEVVYLPAPAPAEVVSPEYIAALEAQARAEAKKPRQPIVAGGPPAIVEGQGVPAEEDGTPEVAEPLPEVASSSSLPTLIISALQITGGPGNTNQDFVKFFNFGSDPVNLNGLRLVKRTKTGSSDTSIKSWTSDEFVSPGGYYVWANSNYAGSETPGVTTSGTISNDNGVAIRQGKADEGEILDSVAWGASENVFIEGSVFLQNPGAGEVLQRKNNQDTGDNGVDFELL